MKPTMTLKLATCAVAVIGLSGCQSMLGKLGFNSSASSRPALTQTIGEPDLVAGQEALRAGNIGQAIISFRLALLDPASQADANNGLGIAYARIGRADLAERYFLKAGELAPRSEKYAANLVRFYESDLARTAQANALRVQQAELAKIEYARTAATTAAAADAPVRSARRGPIMILSRAEGNSASGSPQMASGQRSAARGTITIVQRDGTSPVNMASVSGSQTAAAEANIAPMVIGSRSAARYPVKIALAPKDGADAEASAAPIERIALASRSKTIRPDYPVRIELTPSGSAR